MSETLLDTTVRKSISIKLQSLQQYNESLESTYIDLGSPFSLSKPVNINNRGILTASNHDDPRSQLFSYYDIEKQGVSHVQTILQMDEGYSMNSTMYPTASVRDMYAFNDEIVLITTQDGDLLAYHVGEDLGDDPESFIAPIGLLNYNQTPANGISNSKSSIADIAINPTHTTMYATSNLTRELFVNDIETQQLTYFLQSKSGYFPCVHWDDKNPWLIYAALHHNQLSARTNILSETVGIDLRAPPGASTGIGLGGLPGCIAFSIGKPNDHNLIIGNNQNCLVVYDIRQNSMVELIADHNVELIGDIEFNDSRTEMLTTGTGGWTRWKNHGTSSNLCFVETTHSDPIENEDMYSTTGTFFSTVDAIITDNEGFLTIDTSFLQRMKTTTDRIPANEVSIAQA